MALIIRPGRQGLKTNGKKSEKRMQVSTLDAILDIIRFLSLFNIF